MKLVDKIIDSTWIDLSEIAEFQPGDKLELYNAGVNASEICFTENDDFPVQGTFYKIIKPQTGLIITVGQQPLYVKAGFRVASLMLNKIEV